MSWILLTIFQILEEDLRGATQNINPANQWILLYTHFSCLNLLAIDQIKVVQLQPSFDWQPSHRGAVRPWSTILGSSSGSTFLKIRKSKFSVTKSIFSGRRYSGDLVSCQETPVSSSCNSLTIVTKNQAVSGLFFLHQISEPTINIWKWLELFLKCATNIQTKKLSTSSLQKEGRLDA